MKQIDNKIRMINALNDTLSLLYTQTGAGFSNEDLINIVEEELKKIIKSTECNE